ncbi:MAG: hypothetical protein AABW48_05305 [Nanoarchaeota archaeon]
MLKRGQVTIFVIVGILILAAVSTAIYFSEFKTTEIQREEKSEIGFIKSFVDNCLEQSAQTGMAEVLAKGGYYEFPLDLNVFEFAIEDENLQIPVYFQNEKTAYPSLNFIETEVAKATETALLDCVGDFKSFQEQGYAIDAYAPTIKVQFSDKTLVTSEFPLTIKKDGKETKLTSFSATLSFNFKEKYKIMEEYLAEQKQNPAAFQIGKLSSAVYEQEDAFGFKQLGETGSEVLVDLIYDTKYTDEPIVYSFALNFDWADLSQEQEGLGLAGLKTEEPTFQLKPLSEWNINAPGIHALQVEAIGESLLFETDSASLPIDPRTGIITVNTADFPNDEYIYFIKVSDGYGRETTSSLIINVNVNNGLLPVIEPIEKQTIKVGEEFQYKVNVLNTGNLLHFTSQTYLFSIDEKTGEIKFKPTQDDLGVHTIRIDVENEFGRTWQRWELEVVK